MSNKDKNDIAAMGEMNHEMPPEKPTWVSPHPNDDLLYVVNNGTDTVSYTHLTLPTTPYV